MWVHMKLRPCVSHASLPKKFDIHNPGSHSYSIYLIHSFSRWAIKFAQLSDTQVRFCKLRVCGRQSFLSSRIRCRYRIVNSSGARFALARLNSDDTTKRGVSSGVDQNLSKMVKTIKVHKVGGPEVLSWEDVEVGEPGPGQVRIRHTAIGLNFIDVYFRTGVYKSSLPHIPGREAAGVVTAVGPGLTGVRIGDRVAYASVSGAYCEERLMSADRLVPLPSSVDDITAAAVLLKGMTAQFLLRRTFKVEPGHTILVHAAAGGVGSLLVQWGHALGATVIAAVSTEEKAAQARDDGADHVVIYSREDIVTRVKEITNGAGVHVVYDSVGKDTLQGSLDALAVRGYLVLFGQSSGLPDPLPVSALAPKSLFLTRPNLLSYTRTRDELLATAGDEVLLGPSRKDVRRAVRLIIFEEEGKEFSKNANKCKRVLSAAEEDCGSSYRALLQLVDETLLRSEGKVKKR